MQKGWDIENRVYAKHSEAWVRYDGKTIMVFSSRNHGTDYMQRAQRFIDNYDDSLSDREEKE